jgi:hypothetical protein
MVQLIKKYIEPGPEGLFDNLDDMGKEGLYPPWGRPDTRVVGLFIRHWLFIAMRYHALIISRLALLADQHRDMGLCKRTLTTCYDRLATMRQELSNGIQVAKGNMDRLRSWRRSQVADVLCGWEEKQTVLDAMDVSRSLPCAFWRDVYTGKMHFHHAKEVGILIHDVDYSEAQAKAIRERDDYMSRLNAHIDRMLAGDDAFMKAWNNTYSMASKVLTPTPPIPNVKVGI